MRTREAAGVTSNVPDDCPIAVDEWLHRTLMATSDTPTTFRERSSHNRRERARLLGNFGRELAHELRNRLGTAEAALHVLATAGPEASADVRERALIILKHTLERIKGVADDVHALAIAQGTEETSRGRRLSLRALLDVAVAELCGLAAEKGVRLEVSGEIPDVQVDATRVELALINLIGNAVKYSDPGKSDRWVRLSVERNPKGLRLAIADNGVGIPDELQGGVFEQFVRAHPKLADGTGLGLSIVREAVEQMGGRVWLESRDGEGTTFYFTILDPLAAQV